MKMLSKQGPKLLLRSVVLSDLLDEVTASSGSLKKGAKDTLFPPCEDFIALQNGKLPWSNFASWWSCNVRASVVLLILGCRIFCLNTKLFLTKGPETLCDTKHTILLPCLIKEEKLRWSRQGRDDETSLQTYSLPSFCWWTKDLLVDLLVV